MYKKTLVESGQPLCSNLIALFMKVEYNHLYTHLVFRALHRLPVIVDPFREHIENYITGIVKNNESHLCAIYANPEHIHFLISHSLMISEEQSPQ